MRIQLFEFISGDPIAELNMDAVPVERQRVHLSGDPGAESFRHVMDLEWRIDPGTPGDPYHPPSASVSVFLGEPRNVES